MISFWQFEGYKFDPNGEYVRRWLPELARLPTDWIHHPWNAPGSVLQAAGIELGSNYPLPIVEIAAAKARIQEAIVEMWQLEAVSRATVENGTEEGLGDSSDVAPIDFPQDVQMEVEREPARAHNAGALARRNEDQMVPSMTSSLARDDEEASADLRRSHGDNRTEVPGNMMGFDPEPPRGAANQGGAAPVGETADILRLNPIGLEDAADSTSESSSSWTGRDGGVVPVWSPPMVSSHSEHFMGEDGGGGGGGGGGYTRRHPPSHQLMNWSQLSHTR